MGVLIKGFLVLSSIFILGNIAQDGVINGGVQISSDFRHSAIEVTVNETTGEHQVSNAIEQNTMTINGLTDQTAEFIVYNNQISTVGSFTNYSVELGSVTYTFDIVQEFQVPEHQGQVIINTASVLTNPESSIVDKIGKILNGNQVNPASSSRKRSYVEDDEEEEEEETPRPKSNHGEHTGSKFHVITTGDFHKRWFIQEAKKKGIYMKRLSPKKVEELKKKKANDLIEEILGSNPEYKKRKRSYHEEADELLNKELLSLENGEVLDEDKSFLFFLKKHGSEKWKMATALDELTHSLGEIITYVIEDRSGEGNKSRKRGINTGIGATVAINSPSNQIFSEVGGACDAVKYGASILSGDTTDVCVMNAIGYLSSKTDAKLNVFETQIDLLAKAGKANAEALDKMGNIVTQVENQIGLVQTQMDTVNSVIKDQSDQIAQLSISQQQDAYTQQILAYTLSVQSADLMRTQFQVNANNDALEEKFNGIAGVLSDTTQSIQNEMKQLEDQARAMALNQYVQITRNQIISIKEVTRQFTSMGLDINTRVSQLTSVIQDYLNQLNTNQARTEQRVKLLLQTITDMKKTITELIRQEMLNGDLAIQAYIYLDIISNDVNNGYKPYIDYNTGVPPPNLLEPTIRDGLMINYTFIDHTKCSFTEAQVNQIDSIVNSRLQSSAIITLQIPIGVHPYYVRYSGDSATMITVANANIIRFNFIALFQSVSSPNLKAEYVLTTSVAGSASPLFVPNTFANRHSNNAASCFFSRFDITDADYKRVEDGDKVMLHCQFGLNSYTVNLGIAGTYQFNTGILSSNSYALQIRNNLTTLSESNIRFIKRAPFSQSDGIILINHPGSRTSSVGDIPANLSPIIYPSTSFSSPVSSGNLKLVGLRFPLLTDPELTNSQVQSTLVTSLTANNTIGLYDNLVSVTQPTSVSRKRSVRTQSNGSRKNRRSVNSAPSGTDLPTLEECYAGLDNYPVSYGPYYNLLPSTAQNKVQQCVAKPGCTYLHHSINNNALGFTNPDFTGEKRNFPTGVNSYIMEEIGIKSVLIPPYIVTQDYLSSTITSDKRCAIYGFNCTFYSQSKCMHSDDSTWKARTVIDNSGNKQPLDALTAVANSCGQSAYPMYTNSEGDLYSGSPDDRIFRENFKSHPTKCYNNVAQADNKYWVYYCSIDDKAFGSSAVYDDYYYETTTGDKRGDDDSFLTNICGARITATQASRDSIFGGATLGHSAEEFKTYFATPGGQRCEACLPGYGGDLFGSSDTSYPYSALPGLAASKGYRKTTTSGRVCNPKLMDSGQGGNYGGINGVLFWRATDGKPFKPGRFNINTSYPGTTAATFGACVPHQKEYNNYQTSRTATYDIPYFKTANDTFGGKYTMIDVALVQTYPNCTYLDSKECQQMATREGYCGWYPDPNLTNTETSNLVMGCFMYQDTPCYSIKNMYSCIVATKRSNDGIDQKVCMWDTMTNGCTPLQKEIVGSTMAATTMNPRYLLPCEFRATSETSCSPYGCYLKKYESYALCRTINLSNSTLIANPNNPIKLVIDTKAKALSLLSSLGIVNWSECWMSLASCNIMGGIGETSQLTTRQITLRLQYILGLASDFNPANNQIDCQIYSSSKATGLCNDRFVFSLSNYPSYAMDSDAQRTEDLTSYCIPLNGNCQYNCRLASTNVAKCITYGHCFTYQTNFTCLPNDPAITQTQRLCETTFGALGSKCIQNGNLCTLLNANRFLNGTTFTVNQTDSETSNNNKLANSECAKIGGYISGSMNLVSSSSRLSAVSGLVLPSLSGLCTAKADDTGIYCYPTNLVGGCGNADYCNMVNDIFASMLDSINYEYCSYTDMPSCLLATKDNKNFPCAWVSSSGNFEYCANLADASAANQYGDSVKVYTAAYLLEENRVTYDVVKGTAANLTALGIDLSKIHYGMVTDPSTQMIIISSLTIPCPTGYFPRAHLCCLGSDSTGPCQTYIPNSNHPKQAYFDAVLSIKPSCKYEVTGVLSTVCYTRDAVSNGVTLSPPTLTNYYVCEPFFNSAMDNLFQVYDYTERDAEQVRIPANVGYKGKGTGQMITLTPLMKFEYSVQDPVFREIADSRYYPLLNTNFGFDFVANISIGAFSSTLNSVPIFSLNNLTEVNTVQYGFYTKRSVLALNIQNTIDSMNRNYILTCRSLFGDPPAGWGISLPIGISTKRTYASSTSDNQPAFKIDGITFTYGSPIFDVPVMKFAGATSPVYTAKLVRDGSTVVEAQSVTVNDPYASLLPQPGQRFIFKVTNTSVIGVPDSAIGLGQPNRIGYIYKETPGEFNITDYMKQNPLYDAKFATLSADYYSTDVIEGAEVGSSEYYCGDTVIDALESSQQVVRYALLLQKIRYQFLNSFQQSNWLQNTPLNLASRNTTEGLQALDIFERNLDAFSSIWKSVGCPYDLVNFVPLGNQVDLFYHWYFLYGDLSAASLQAITAEAANYYNSGRYVQCGNCFLINDGAGNFLASTKPGECEPSYGTTVPRNPPSVVNLNIQSIVNNIFCSLSRYYEITIEATRVKFKLKPNLGRVVSIWNLPVHDSLTQYTSQSVCLTNPTLAQYKPDVTGVYQIKLKNPLANTAVDGIVRIRASSELLGFSYPLLVLPVSCDQDFPISIPAGENATISIPVCTTQSFYLQIYNLIGKACSPVFSSEIDYTNVLPDLTSNNIQIETVTSSLLKEYVSQLESSLEAASANINVKVDQITLKLNDSIWNNTMNLQFLNASLVQQIETLQNAASVVFDLQNVAFISQLKLQQFNNSVTDISSQVNLVIDLTNQTAQDMIQLQKDIASNIDTIQNNTVLSQQLWNLTDYIGGLIDSYLRTVEDYKKFLDQVDNLNATAMAAFANINDLSNTATTGQQFVNKLSTLVVALIVISSILGVGLIVTLIYYATKKGYGNGKQLKEVGVSKATPSFLPGKPH